MLTITLKVIKDNNPLWIFRYHRKQAFRRFIESKSWSGCTFRLIVNYGSGLKNEGNYNTKKELVFAYESFTQKSLVDEIKAWIG